MDRCVHTKALHVRPALFLCGRNRPMSENETYGEVLSADRTIITVDDPETGGPIRLSIDQLSDDQMNLGYAESHLEIRQAEDLMRALRRAIKATKDAAR